MLGLLLWLLAGDPDVKFLLPKRQIILAGPRGTTFELQGWVQNHADNRGVRFAWDGESCAGDHAWDIEPDSPRIQPTYRPLLVTAGPGQCDLRIIVYGPGGRIRATASMTMRVCGGEECS